MRERRIWMHWQNLNEKPGDRGRASGHAFWYGRAWLHVLSLCFGLEWNFGRLGCGVRFAVNADEPDIMASVSLPGMSFYFTVGGSPVGRLFKLLRMDWETRRARRKSEHDFDHLYTGHRALELRINDGALWWSCWAKCGHWSSTDPWWLSGSFSPADFFLGRHKYSETALDSRPVVVAMPEGIYNGTAELKRRTWKRPRWPFALQRLGVVLEVPEGIPIPGKGENSWDCGPDAIYSQSSSARSVEEAIGQLVESALKTRMQRCGSHVYTEREKPRPPSTPSTPSQAEVAS